MTYIKKQEGDVLSISDIREEEEVIIIMEDKPKPKRFFGWTSNDGVKGLLNYAKNPIKRITTGIFPIDSMLGGGVGKGEVCVILGKSGSGKSILGQNILEANLDVPAVFFSYEMPGNMVLTRSLAMWSGKSHDTIFNMVEGNTLDQEMLSDWEDSHRKHYYITRTGLDLTSMSIALNECAEQIGEKPALVVIDYMELVASAGGGETIDNITSIAQGLKGWAKEENVACVILHQTNKTLKHGDAPDDDAARYGGFTEADIVIGVWRPHRWQPKTRSENPMNEHQITYLKDYIGINLIKNRPKITVQEQGYLVPISESGKIRVATGVNLEVYRAGTGGVF